MEKVIFGNKNGLGLILSESEIESNYFENQNLKVVDEILTPENETTLKNFFTKKVIYKGTLKKHKNCMVFYLGNESNLFDSL
jgi:phosphoribosylaminoimidazole-succinocarboxamide synthase